MPKTRSRHSISSIQNSVRQQADLESRLGEALAKARACLLSLRDSQGIWAGELSASALATATAVVALELMQRHGPTSDSRSEECLRRGKAWLAAHSNPDGGWGDTIQSQSNISTTTLVWAALQSAPGKPESNVDQAISAGGAWIHRCSGSVEPEQVAAKILERYGQDRTFSAPILTHCALAGLFGSGPKAWRQVTALPFELAALPAEWFGALRLPVVSYALPALIAIGYARHYHAPSRILPLRWVRSRVTPRVLRVLESIQPANGGFLEAIPLTSFVVMSLAGADQANHPVARRGLQFILNSAQSDGSWKIDTNLSTFVTTLAVQALTGHSSGSFSPPERIAIQDWLLRQQYRTLHPYTNAAPGGWAWTPLPGGVPDADDTSGALIALSRLQVHGSEAMEAAQEGVRWLLNLQNRDGGIPTFCRGWGKLPFDHSSADITAHALRAWTAWERSLPEPAGKAILRAKRRAIEFLVGSQEQTGSWAPLWFGNQFEPDESNRVYGTSRVVLALAETGLAQDSLERAVRWLTQAQRPDGGWNGGTGPGPSSTEETSLALEALCAKAGATPSDELDLAIRRGLNHLLERINDGSWVEPAPIGFYFAKLWYYEKLYPVIFSTAALAGAGHWFSTKRRSQPSTRC